MIYLPIADGYSDVPSTTVASEMQTLEQAIDPGRSLPPKTRTPTA